MTETMQQVDIAKIALSTTGSQVLRRGHYDQAKMAELTESVKKYGVLQPVIGRPVKRAKHTVQLVAGERRVAASKAAGLETVPMIVRELTDEQVIEVQLIENLQREDLHPMQEAEGYQELMQKHHHPIEELHARVGKSRSYVYGRIKLLMLNQICRKAFYAGKINASIALLLARIPVDKLQREALIEILNMRMSYRRAQGHVQENYMLRLANSYFPKKDAELVPAAGACGPCPKRTGSSPDLFGDVKSADVCTDPVCFHAKTVAFSERRLANARQQGRPVLTGSAASKAISYGQRPDDLHLVGYKAMSDRDYRDGKNRTVRQIIGKDVETTLLEHPAKGFVIEVVANSVVDAALRKGKPKPASSPQNVQANKAKIERAFRAALYERLRPKLGIPSDDTLAAALWRESTHDTLKAVAKLQGWEPKKERWGGKDYRGLAKKIPDLSNKVLFSLLNDLIYASELQVANWSTGKAEGLLALAKRHRVDVKAVRRAVTPKAKKKQKKKAKKKARRK